MECSEFNLEKGTFTVAVGCAGEMRRRIKTGTEIELNAAGWSWVVCKIQKKKINLTVGHWMHRRSLLNKRMHHFCARLKEQFDSRRSISEIIQ